MQASSILTNTLESLRMGQRRIVHQGGQYSGKTVNILGALASMASEDDEGGVTTVTSMSFPHLKGGALRDFEMYVYPTFKSTIKQYHKTDHIFTFKSGHMMEFKVFDNEFSARGQKRKRLFINEANKFEKMMFFQLDSRSDQTIIDYNPSIRFWAHEDLIGQPGNLLYISDHRHNPFLSEDKHREIENICVWETDEYGNRIKDEKGRDIVKRGDPELWKVYARGLTGNVTGVIFPNWRMINDEDFPDDEDFVWSIDFGYTNDPTVIIKQVLIGNTLFVKELCYEPGLPPKDIYKILVANGWKDSMFVYCDHDPDMIKGCRKAGIKFANPARKGQGSINSGIELLHTYDVRYTCGSRNINRERGLYIWETDKVTGKLTNIPIETNNHTFDAIRYGAYTKYLRA